MSGIDSIRDLTGASFNGAESQKLGMQTLGYLQHTRGLLQRNVSMLQILGIGGWTVSFCLNPEIHQPHLPYVVPIALLLAIVGISKGKGAGFNIWRWGTILYAVLLAGAFRLQLSMMSENRELLTLPLAILITMGLAGLIPLRRDYVVMNLLCWVVVIAGPGMLPEGMSDVLAALLVMAAIAVGILTNSAVVTNLWETFKLKEEFRKLAEIDQVTELPNRRAIINHLDRLQLGPSCPPYAFAMVDLDNFKLINDRLGHDIGDMVLRGFGDALRELPDRVFAGRLGGEEFAIVLQGYSQAEAHNVLEAFLEQIRARTMAGTQVSFSAGCVAVRRDETVSEILRRADLALYAAKRAGKARLMWDELVA